MKSLKAEDKFNISGRGLVILVKFPNPDRLRCCPDLPKIGEKVFIDNIKYKITGIESSMKLTNPPFMAEEVGLLVKEIV